MVLFNLFVCLSILHAGVFSLYWGFAGRPELGGDLAARWTYLQETFNSNRVCAISAGNAAARQTGLSPLGLVILTCQRHSLDVLLSFSACRPIVGSTSQHLSSLTWCLLIVCLSSVLLLLLLQVFWAFWFDMVLFYTFQLTFLQAAPAQYKYVPFFGLAGWLMAGGTRPEEVDNGDAGSV